LQYYQNKKIDLENHPLEYYKIGDKINFRIRSKTDITKTIENQTLKNDLLNATISLRDDFIVKIKSIVQNNESDSNYVLSKNLESIFNVSSIGRRTQQSFYALWYFMSDISFNSIIKHKEQIRQDLHSLFQSMNDIKSKELFSNQISEFKKRYK
jgi:hypothetical protein